MAGLWLLPSHTTLPKGVPRPQVLIPPHLAHVLYARPASRSACHGQHDTAPTCCQRASSRSGALGWRPPAAPARLSGLPWVGHGVAHSDSLHVLILQGQSGGVSITVLPGMAQSRYELLQSDGHCVLILQGHSR